MYDIELGGGFPLPPPPPYYVKGRGKYIWVLKDKNCSRASAYSIRDYNLTKLLGDKYFDGYYMLCSSRPMSYEPKINRFLKFLKKIIGTYKAEHYYTHFKYNGLELKIEKEFYDYKYYFQQRETDIIPIPFNELDDYIEKYLLENNIKMSLDYIK